MTKRHILQKVNQDIPFVHFSRTLSLRLQEEKTKFEEVPRSFFMWPMIKWKRIKKQHKQGRWPTLFCLFCIYCSIFL
jgi:hypothetical protein